MDETGNRKKALDFLAHAAARLDECRRLKANKLPNRMIARFAYLSLLYSALALLETRGLAGGFDLDAPPVQHERMIMLFHVNFVKTGIAAPETSDALSRTFDIWNDNDRNPVTTVAGADSDNFVERAGQLLSTAENLIKNNGYGDNA